MLAMTLRSVLRQQSVDLEVIVVDEASTDDTASMLAAVNDTRVSIIRHDTPHGLSAARNHGAFEARGQWLAFVDDDDLWAPDKLVRQIEAAEQAGRDWAGRRAPHPAQELCRLAGVRHAAGIPLAQR